MCTASWLTTAAGYELFFSRDELATRLPARSPKLEHFGNVRVLTPRDANAGGSWIGVNEFGLALGLLNAWELEAQDSFRDFTSRGLLLTELLASPSPEEVRERMGRTDLDRFRGFRLGIFAPGREPEVLSWDKKELAAETVRMPLASSGLGAEQAYRARRSVLEETLSPHSPHSRGSRADATPELLLSFHQSHAPSRSAWSPCMHREDAKTVSLSRIRVDERTVEFRYLAGSPCELDRGESAWDEPLRMERRESLRTPAG